MLPRYQLGRLYASLRAAIRAGQWPQASNLLGAALGLAPGAHLPGRPDAAAVTEAARHALVRQLGYRGFKPAELAMVAGDLKPVVKLEDIPIAQADAFVARHGATRHIRVGAPYRKDYLLLRSTPCAVSDPAALVCLYVAARGQPAVADALADLEAAAREDAVAAGQLLGIPDCCAAAFAADFDRSRADQDTLNDDACRRMLAGAASTAGAPWWSNPLADHELLGFYPCRVDCAASRDRAARNLAWLQHIRPVEADRARQRLQQAVLYFRLPFFCVLTGQWQENAFVVDTLSVNAFPDREVQAAQALLAAHLLAWLPPGSRLGVSASGLWRSLPHASAADTADHLDFSAEACPLLCRWTPDDLAAVHAPQDFGAATFFS